MVFFCHHRQQAKTVRPINGTTTGAAKIRKLRIPETTAEDIAATANTMTINFLEKLSIDRKNQV
ncbi:MAG: hypothetical protein ACFB2W_10345 [Leptolyngbyaceae cyanobacterium]